MRCLRLVACSLCCFGVIHPPTARAQEPSPVVIVTPQDGAVVPPDFTVTVSSKNLDVADTDYDGSVPPEEISLFADSMHLADCPECPDGDAQFHIMLAPGQHSLKARASASYVEAYSDPITVTVQESGTEGPTGGGDSDAGTATIGSTTADNGPDKAGGCACDVTGAAGQLLPWLGVLALGVRRRRR